jgi:hypothetical protein
MRLSLFCWISLAFMMAGCCAHESASSSDANAKSADAECKTGDCCSTISRSSLLKSSATQEEAKPSDDESK